MKFPSVDQALQDARRTFVRFPFVIVDAALGTAAVLLLILACALHLFVAAAPFTGRGQVNGFWHYNKTMFLRIAGDKP
jgi:hypothetical protein